MKLDKNENTQFAAVDVGGTNTRFALFDKEGKIICKYKTATDSMVAENTINWVIDKIKEHKIKYLALCIPGPSDYENGVVLKSPNLLGSWENFDVKKYILKNVELNDIVFENDANVMALSNHNAYNCRDSDISQFFTISTGFGAGLVIEGKIYHGNKYYAQEIAQIPLSIKPFTGKHRLKNSFALELHCSGSGLETQAKALGIAQSTKELLEKYNEGDEKATELIDNAIETLARMFCVSAATVAPTNFFVGGSVALNAEWMVLKAFEKAQEYADPNHFRNVNLYFDTNGDDSALQGLYYLIKQRNFG
ncbi:ROK family protein [Mycoplasma hafezii]|uniref:ROK family protein n=1 Tax=Mycoplasma hafezii TaxID=525886 RepID=UPI003CE81D8F